ncbi:MAG TPA: PilZ domain-containing protein [Myxococcota bacterium]|nr:PilZ domain-containing protein [Myxococcota bacterium]
MATRKKAKRAARKTRKARKAPKSRKTTARATRKRVARRAKARPAVAIDSVLHFDDTAAPRCRSRIPVEIDIAGRRERGAIADMSASGARIVGVHTDLPPGTPLEIRYASVSAPVLLSAEIVRVTEDGFAVRINPRGK